MSLVTLTMPPLKEIEDAAFIAWRTVCAEGFLPAALPPNEGGAAAIAKNHPRYSNQGRRLECYNVGSSGRNSAGGGHRPFFLIV